MFSEPSLPMYDKERWMRSLKSVSRALHIWKPKSRFDTIELKAAAAARTLLARPDVVARASKERRWADVGTAVTLAEADLSKDLAITGPALYRTPREGTTLFYLRGGGALNLEKLRRLANPLS